jgi:hypothetical protein
MEGYTFNTITFRFELHLVDKRGIRSRLGHIVAVACYVTFTLVSSCILFGVYVEIYRKNGNTSMMSALSNEVYRLLLE